MQNEDEQVFSHISAGVVYSSPVAAATATATGGVCVGAVHLPFSIRSTCYMPPATPPSVPILVV